MNPIIIRPLELTDKKNFLDAMNRSQALHHPWVSAPLTSQAFDEFFLRSQAPNQECHLVIDQANHIIGVFNINEIVRGFFQNAFLGFYVVNDYASKGYMHAGLLLVLDRVFNVLKLHRLEANIQPENQRSIKLIKRAGFRNEGYSPRYLKINEQWCGHEHYAMTVEDYISISTDIFKNERVDIVPYDPEWGAKAIAEINQLRKTLPAGKIIDIQHVGSTAIPGLASKPVIDIQIAVNSLDEMKIIAVPALQKLEYEYWADNPDPERLFFVKGMPPFGEVRTHHVHISQPTSKHWNDKIRFRDYLIAHPVIAGEYQALKIKLAAQYPNDREAYTDAKGEFVKMVLALSK